jgi:hypothetical protein
MSNDYATSWVSNVLIGVYNVSFFVSCIFFVSQQYWSKVKPEFVNNFSIRHTKSGKYLAVSANHSLTLSKKYNETCIFGVWKRQGQIFGLQSKYSRRWAGQNVLGNLVCSAYSFDRREEWDVRTMSI